MAAGTELVHNTVVDDHFAVEGIERPNSKIAMLQQLLDAHLAVIDCVQQRGHGRCLEEFVGLRLDAFERGTARTGQYTVYGRKHCLHGSILTIHKSSFASPNIVEIGHKVQYM